MGAILKKLWIILFTYIMAAHCAIYAQVFCPICEKSADVFLSSPTAVSRDNASCPNCHSLERHRHLWLFLKENKEEFFEKKLTLLHWAPEPCLSKVLKSMDDIYYIPTNLKPKKSDVYKFNINEIALDTNSVDVIFCNHVLDCVPNDRQAIAELFRVLRPGGYAIVMVQLYDLDRTYEDSSILNPIARELKFGQFDHVRKYGNDITNRLKSAGFNVEEFPLSRLSDDSRIQYALSGYDDEDQINATRGADIFLCTKPESDSKNRFKKTRSGLRTYSKKLKAREATKKRPTR